jgi:hypothetical protein
MHHVRQENLPFVGSSHEFVGAEQGNTVSFRSACVGSTRRATFFGSLGYCATTR